MLFDLRRRRCENVLLGLILGVIIALFVIFNQQSCRMTKYLSTIPIKSLNIPKNESIADSARTLLFVGVMTAEKYLTTRAVAVYQTWGKTIPGHIAFFSSSYSQPPENWPDLPLVPLPNVDDSYPPQKKSFLMLEYMWTYYGNSFEWFMRADDDVYVRSDKLEKLLRSVDSSKLQFIGQAGRGNQEEFGLLSLEYDENFCMGGPGVIMSRATLSRVAPHIKYCLKNLYTTHEDVELGRCVRRFAKIPCTWSYEMQTILYHNSSGNSAFTGNLKSKEVHKAITLHPVKQYKHLYRINNYMKGLKIQEMQQDIINAQRDIFVMNKYMDNSQEETLNAISLNTSINHITHNQILGETISMNMFQPRLENEILKWEFISRSLFSDTNSNPRRRMESGFQEGTDDVIREVMEMINLYSKQRGRVIEFREILYGYRRNNPLYGADWILDLLLLYKKYRGRKMTIPVRRHLYLHQSFLGIEMQEVPLELETLIDEMPNPSKLNIPNLNLNLFRNFQRTTIRNTTFHLKDKLINFILPLSGRFDTFKRFLNTYEQVCLKNNQNVALYLVLFPSETENSINATQSSVERLQKNYPSSFMKVILVYKHAFARALALQIGVSHIKSNNSLLFFIDVDMIFTANTLERIRLNTIKNKQVYFPIVYTQYDPFITYPNTGKTPDNFLINENTGHWRHFGFGIGSMYKSDFLSVGGFDTSIQGWGKEDVDLYDKFISSPITVFRAVDPELIHIFHIVRCDPNLERSQLKMCQGTRADTFGGVKQLAQFLEKYPEILSSYRKSKKKV